jgi:alkylated DNA repair dioxygenase AlkB
MDLFPIDPNTNLLPRDGTVFYRGPVFGPHEADRILADLLQHIPWTHDVAVLFGKRIVTARKVAWFGDSGLSYTYSGTTKHAAPWTDALRSLKHTVERVTAATYNSCLLNLYRDGSQGMSWHSDDERSMAEEAPIASLSFGAERPFRFKHKETGESLSLVLAHGSLLDMRGVTQKFWRHCLPKSTQVLAPRVKLTFRTVLAPTR